MARAAQMQNGLVVAILVSHMAALLPTIQSITKVFQSAAPKIYESSKNSSGPEDLKHPERPGDPKMYESFKNSNDPEYRKHRKHLQDPQDPGNAGTGKISGIPEARSSVIIHTIMTMRIAL